jgi:hypothetical protein
MRDFIRSGRSGKVEQVEEVQRADSANEVRLVAHEPIQAVDSIGDYRLSQLEISSRSQVFESAGWTFPLFHFFQFSTFVTQS